MNLLQITPIVEPMSLEARVKKAIANIDKAIGEKTNSEILTLTGTEYLNNKKLLLINLLESETW